MCGIFGLVVPGESGHEGTVVEDALRTLARLSESRGKDSSGLAFRDERQGQMRVLRGAIPLAKLLPSAEVRHEFTRLLDGRRPGAPVTFAAMGHSRLVTNGSQINDDNNQPVVKDGVIGIHNGIIVNERDLWARHSDLRRSYEIDTEVLLALVRKRIEDGCDAGSAVASAMREVKGTVAAAFLFDDLDVLVTATNNGSLYLLTDERRVLAFASEEYFLRKMLGTRLFRGSAACRIRQVPAGGCVVLDLLDHSVEALPVLPVRRSFVRRREKQSIAIRSLQGGVQKELVLDPARIAAHPGAAGEARALERNAERVARLRRCARCILPETFPFITFDADGTCNYCTHYRVKNAPKPIEELFELVKPYRRTDGAYDCIVPYSGGRDSTFTLHVAKRVLGLNPVAFTYDWGMVNDLARRNIARVCGKLGVENIIVSADVRWKRENIRKNVEAWLSRPHLGMVPLFMAGDKFFFYYTDQVKRQTGVKLNIWGINPLENTDFKVGFLGVPPDHAKERIYSLSARRQALLFVNVLRCVAENPRYVNRSVWDTLGSFVSRSVVPHRDYYHLFDYCRWDEGEIDRLVREEYEWETAIDTNTTWRIGDGTAAFYNYVYYTVAGFSEYDTFRSNQIREGMLSREEALRLVDEENRPRYASIKWYTEIIGVDFTSAVARINAIPKLYS